MADRKQPYLSYLLRLWQAGDDDPVWRASLESPGTGERHAFANVELLFAFLEAETTATTDQEWRDGEGETDTLTQRNPKGSTWKGG